MGCFIYIFCCVALLSSGEKVFDTDALSSFLRQVESDHDSFFAVEILKRGGFIGSQTPEAYICEATHDREEDVASCLFPHQDPQCWEPDYWLQK